MPPAAARFDHCKQDLRWKHDRTGGMVTVHPQHVSAAMLEAVDTALAVGKAPERMLQPFGRVPPVELKDGGLAADAEQIESRGGLESRSRIRDAIEKRYTLPA